MTLEQLFFSEPFSSSVCARIRFPGYPGDTPEKKIEHEKPFEKKIQ